MTDIDNMTDEEFKEHAAAVRKKLDDEASLRQAKKLEEKRARNREMLQVFKDYPSIFQFLKHSRTSCSDDSPINGYDEHRGHARCTKCHLMEIVDSEDDSFEISLDVTIMKSTGRF